MLLAAAPVGDFQRVRVALHAAEQVLLHQPVLQQLMAQAVGRQLIGRRGAVEQILRVHPRLMATEGKPVRSLADIRQATAGAQALALQRRHDLVGVLDRHGVPIAHPGGVVKAHEDLPVVGIHLDPGGARRRVDRRQIAANMLPGKTRAIEAVRRIAVTIAPFPSAESTVNRSGPG